MGGGLSGERSTGNAKVPSPHPHATSGPVGMRCPILYLSLWPALPMSGLCPCHHVGLSNCSATACRALAPAGPTILPGVPPPPRTQALCSAGTHTAPARCQGTVAGDLLPFVLVLVSWRLQVNEGDGFFISDPLLQVELHQVQHLWRAQGTEMATRWQLGAACSCQAA